MTRLVKAIYVHGPVKAGDDIAEVKWVDPFDFDYENEMVKEHHSLYKALLNNLKKTE